MWLLYPSAMYHFYLMLPHQASGPLQFGKVVEGSNIPWHLVGLNSGSQ